MELPLTPEMQKNRALFANRSIPEPATLRDDYATRAAALPGNAETVFYHLTRRDLKLSPPSELVGQARNQWLKGFPEEVEIEEGGVKQTLRGEELNRWKYQRYMKDYLACVQGVDDNIGRCMGWLKAEGLDQNTVVFYASDNGFYLGEHGMYDKRFMCEPSLRVPLLATGPGVKASQTTDAFALNIDFAPTFLELAQAPIPADLQGHSLVSILKAKTPKDWRKSMYYRY